MKNITIYIKAFVSLGWLGAIAILMAAIIATVAVIQPMEPFGAAFDSMDVLNMLESRIAFNLAEMELEEANTLFTITYGLNDTGSLNKAEQLDGTIDSDLSEVEDATGEETDIFYLADAVNEGVNSLNQAREDHRQNFSDALVYAEGNIEMDYDPILALEDSAQSLSFSLNDDLIVPVESGRLDAKTTFVDDADLAIKASVIGLAIIMILALIGYQLISDTVRPLRHLRNTIMAIGGDMYRSETNQLMKKGGSAAALAKALDNLAKAETHRNETLHAEIEKLRQEMYESRRRRLKIYHENKKAE